MRLGFHAAPALGLLLALVLGACAELPTADTDVTVPVDWRAQGYDILDRPQG